LNWLLDLWGDLFLLSGVRLDHVEWAHWLEAWEANSLNDLAQVASWLSAGNWDFIHLLGRLVEDLVELSGHGVDVLGHLVLLFLESEEESGLGLNTWHI
tara:strand:- start:144 stop:440 length:297 start_codon:yes stop_codon:yes gene_type:complete